MYRGAEYKTEALKLAERVGFPDAASQLGLHEQKPASQLIRHQDFLLIC